MFSFLSKIFTSNINKNIKNFQLNKEIIESTPKITLHAYDEIPYSLKILFKKKRIIVDLSELKKTDKRRVLDFLSGIIYKKGKVIAISDTQYFFMIA